MPDGAKHHVLLVQHGADPRLHGIMRFDQVAHIVRPCRVDRRFGMADPAEAPGAVGQRGERPRDPPQHEPQQAEEHDEQDHRLEHERPHDRAVALRNRQARDLPNVAALLAQADDEHLLRCVAQACGEAGKAFARAGDQRVGQCRASGDDELVDGDTLRHEHLA